MFFKKAATLFLMGSCCLAMINGCASAPKTPSVFYKAVEPVATGTMFIQDSYAYYRKFKRWPADIKEFVKFALEEQRPTEASIESQLSDLKDVNFIINNDNSLIIQGIITNYLFSNKDKSFVVRISLRECSYEIGGQNIFTFPVNEDLKFEAPEKISIKIPKE